MNKGDKEKAIDIIEDAFFVQGADTIAIDTNNGILNNGKLEYEKKHLLNKSIGYLSDELVKMRQHFPHNDLSDVDMELSFVILPVDKFFKLKEIIENE